VAIEPNTFAGAHLDRAGARRTDEAWLAERLADPASEAIVVTADGVFVGADGAPARVPVGRAASVAGAGAPVLLGLEPGGTALWAIDAEEVGIEALPAAFESAALTGVRDAAARLSGPDAGLVAYAAGMLNWHRRHTFCANCGAHTEPQEAGHVRACPNCGAVHHPRTDPVVIMLVTDDRDRALLGRQAVWPVGRYSALAGFVEPGESLESAVAREVLEESGVEIDAPRYASSQPWPFPSSLMLGFFARHVAGEPHAVDAELEDVRWFERSELEEAAAGRGGVQLPPRLAIARRLIDEWLQG
jgi:NAD+ diphosphatase